MKTFKVLVPVHYQRGTVSIRAWCLRPRGTAYTLLLNQAWALRECDADFAEQIVLFGRLSAIRRALNIPVCEHGVSRAPTSGEILARAEILADWLDTAGDCIEDLARIHHRNKAERLAALVDSWDITDNGKPLPVNAEVIAANFSPHTLFHFLKTVEAAIPAAASGDATNN